MDALLAYALITLAFCAGLMLGTALAFMYIGRVTDEEIRSGLE